MNAALARLYARSGIAFRARTGEQVRDLLRSWTPLEADGPLTTVSCRQPAPLHERFDHSDAYAILASPGDRTP
ncbi:hypothetical protein [Streptomyces sp. NPDC088812]|uniref:hypothetical protein n=1 Tax=Streptomyces sp. NPDC088812 TaxID=3365905 RepID=UPI00381003F7